MMMMMMMMMIIVIIIIIIVVIICQDDHEKECKAEVEFPRDQILEYWLGGRSSPSL